MAERKGKTPHVSGDVLEYIREREAADPELAKGLKTEFNKLQIARRIKAIREAHNLSQGELAAKVGTKQPAIARLESGRVIPRLDLLYKIAAAMGMRLNVSFVDDEP